MKRLLCLFALAGLACGGAPGQAGYTAAAPTADTVWVDVRTDAEVAAGHVAGALHIPVDQIQARRHELAGNEDRTIALYCRSGRRSGIALETLRRHGFTNAINAGAYRDLERDGHPTATGLPD